METPPDTWIPATSFEADIHDSMEKLKRQTTAACDLFDLRGCVQHDDGCLRPGERVHRHSMSILILYAGTVVLDFSPRVQNLWIC
jgi:hypothetical protein